MTDKNRLGRELDLPDFSNFPKFYTKKDGWDHAWGYLLGVAFGEGLFCAIMFLLYLMMIDVSDQMDPDLIPPFLLSTTAVAAVISWMAIQSKRTIQKIDWSIASLYRDPTGRKLLEDGTDLQKQVNATTNLIDVIKTAHSSLQETGGTTTITNVFHRDELLSEIRDVHAGLRAGAQELLDRQNAHIAVINRKKRELSEPIVTKYENRP